MRPRPAGRQRPAGMWILPAAAFLWATTTAAASAGLCVAGYHSCSALGADFADVCCPLDQTCTLDEADEPACCPAGYTCTGTAPAAATTASVSYVPDYYYGYFPYVVPAGVAASTTLADMDSCDAAVLQCGTNFALCTAVLEGVATVTAAAAAATIAGTGTTGTTATGTATGTATTTTATTNTTPISGTYAVTVVVSGQTTINLHNAAATSTTLILPATEAALVLTVPTTLPATSAASICSYLSTQACGGLPASIFSGSNTGTAGCAVLFSGKTATASINTQTSSSSAGRIARLPSLHKHVAVLAVWAGAVVVGVVLML